MSSQVQQEIERANRFGDEIENLVVAKGECPTGDRNTLLIAYWSLIFDLHRGVLCLVSNKLFGSAFALVRPIVEAAVKAHVVIMGSGRDLRRLRSDKYRTNFGTVGERIDAFFHTDGFFEHFLKGATKALHSYTHAGLLQLGRRFTGRDLRPSYSEGEIIEVIRTTTSAAFLVTNLVTKHFRFEEEWRTCTKLFGQWGEHP
jgi:hypothetical protein